MLFFWAGRDKHIGIEGPRAIADALRAKEKSFVSVEFSDADHGFFCDQRASYNPTAAAEAWPLTLAFLRANTTTRKKLARRISAGPSLAELRAACELLKADPSLRSR